MKSASQQLTLAGMAAHGQQLTMAKGQQGPMLILVCSAVRQPANNPGSNTWVMFNGVHCIDIHMCVRKRAEEQGLV